MFAVALGGYSHAKIAFSAFIAKPCCKYGLNVVNLQVILIAIRFDDCLILISMAESSPSFASIKNSLSTGKGIAPVYLIHGEESYYIDELVSAFESLLPEEERDFNLYTLYAPECGPESIMDVCHQYPMMAERQVVIVKEAQAIRADQLNKLHSYVSRPNPSTVLVIACRGAQAKGKDLIAAVKKNGVIFESKRLRDRDIILVISELIAEKGLTVDPKSLSMLRDYIGTDLSRLYNEIAKLALILGPGATVTPEAIERNIGISKDYNNFELLNAIISRNAAKAFRIVEYFKANPKNNPAIISISTIFGRFQNLLIYHYTKDKSPSGYMDALELKNQWALKEYETAAANYNVRQTIEIISALRQADAQSKGIGSRQNEYALLKGLIFHILTARGIIN